MSFHHQSYDYTAVQHYRILQIETKIPKTMAPGVEETVGKSVRDEMGVMFYDYVVKVLGKEEADKLREQVGKEPTKKAETEAELMRKLTKATEENVHQRDIALVAMDYHRPKRTPVYGGKGSKSWDGQGSTLEDHLKWFELEAEEAGLPVERRAEAWLQTLNATRRLKLIATIESVNLPMEGWEEIKKIPL